ncbi:LOW QUALITY PROTEIN: uncharacterized protein QC763_511820 [Podospora pseudopauciseta]|uniref:Uncharacterized protein n=1 Tax=Podospora pseudopauciseta TaxID=2093780 RepID=A0ABR0H950_9PEZI|nr:LOW QUALITY PROTEIN: hypothetical protein QC763_511820 [Podospora pseudopauciseta]
MSTDWTNDPKAAEKTLQDSLEAELKTHPDRFLRTAKADGKVTFNGDKSPFYAIQAYVWCGMLYPDNDADFQKKLPQSRFKPLELVLPKIYEDTKDALVAVSSSCHKFSSGPMEGVLKKYAVNAKTSLGADDGLGAQLKTLTSDKYKNKESIDEDFEAAKELAKERLEELKSDAKEKEEQSDKLRKDLQDVRFILMFGMGEKELITDLSDFLSETEVNKKQVTAVNDKYLSPVTDSEGKHYKNAMVYLNHELEGLQKKLKDAKDEADNHSKELKEEGDPKGWKFWVNVLSGPTGTWNLYQKLKDFKDALDKWSTQNKETEDVLKCQTTVTALEAQIDDLITRMTKAVEGIRLIQDTFRHLGESLDPVIKAIDKIEKGTSSPLQAIRKSNISHGIQDAVTKYEEIIKEAEDFAKASQIKVIDA